MTLGWAMALGFLLGLRHATDPDHVVAIGTMIQRDASPTRVARLAALWGVGHTLTFVLFGLSMVLARVRVPPRFDRVADLLVAGLLVGLGAWTLHRVRRPTTTAPRWRPLLVGIVHGLAGSAGVALLALTTLATRAEALVYLALFCAGTVAGMVVLTVALALPLGWGVRRYGALPRAFIVGLAILGIAVGVVMALRATA